MGPFFYSPVIRCIVYFIDMPLTSLIIQLINLSLVASTTALYFYYLNLWDDQAFIASSLLGCILAGSLSVYWILKAFFGDKKAGFAAYIYALISPITLIAQTTALAWAVWIKS